MNKINPYNDIEFVKTKAVILDKDGGKIFERDVIFPTYYNENNINIVSSKYFSKNEFDLRQLIDRVSDTITTWGENQGYFSSEEEKTLFNFKLKRYQIKQYFAFNSPMYFNAGLTDKVQASACFILDVKDDMDSIASVVAKESRIFKKGSGSGMNLSHLRSRFEKVSGGDGNASGPVSFLKCHDLSAAIIRSGGALRRSAKLACLNIDHPDIEEFIECKKYEEEKLQILKKANLKTKPGCELSDEVFFQNTNISVGIKDDFIQKVIENGDWHTKYVTTGEIHKKYKSRELFYKLAQNAWECADPGILFLDNMNKWNTCKNDGLIESTNPCGEFVFLNNSSCNLASINLLKFFGQTIDDFDFETFKDVIETVIMAQDITVDAAIYPTDEVTENSHKYRPLGLGYTNLGALLLYFGLPYDSERGRNLAAKLTGLLTGISYLKSNELSEKLGCFERFHQNIDSFYSVLDNHFEYINSKFNIQENQNKSITNHLLDVWKKIKDLRNNNKEFRNAQVTLLAPTGTISFLMGAQTTGIEPEFSHVKYKRLSNTDGAVIKSTSEIIEPALINLGYNQNQIKNIKECIINDKPLKSCKDLNAEHCRIFQTSVSQHPEQVISYHGHIKMLASIQPLISGGISKTINFPNSCTVEDIFKCYIECWKLGLKGVTVYRDGSKNFQPLSTTNENEEETIEIKETDKKLIRQMYSMLAEKKLPPERPAINHKFNVGGLKGYLNCGLYEDGELGEIFVTISKEGSTLSGLLDCLATATSISLQRGVPLKDFVEKMTSQKFEPYGFTSNSEIRTASSIVDYIFRYLGLKFLSYEDKLELGLIQENINDFENHTKDEIKKESLTKSMINDFAGPSCTKCGSIMRRIGSCFQCTSCGNSNGSCG